MRLLSGGMKYGVPEAASLESLILKRPRVLDSFQDQGYLASRMHVVSGITGDLRIPVSAM
jgi:hypothetical protein